MERDFFKRYIQEHKDAFENEALPPNMLGNILGNLRERREREEIQTKKRRLSYTWLAVACSIFIVAGAYLFFSQQTAIIAKPDAHFASNQIEIKQPVISKNGAVPKLEKPVVKLQKEPVANHLKGEKHKEIYDGLANSLSVASRLDAIIKANSLASLNKKLKTELCRTFNEDDNDNVRLAALEVLSKFSNDKYIQEHLMSGLTLQKDPMVQIELVKIMSNNNNPQTTDKLIAMANNPYTIDAVKDQVYYTLLTHDVRF